MKAKHFCFLVLCGATLVTATVQAQHCPPINESYLGELSLRHDVQRHSLDLKLRYAKDGGQEMPKYQVYLLAYLDRDASRVPAPLPADLIDPQVVCVLDTQLAERDADGSYPVAWRLEMTELAKRIIEMGKFSEQDRNDFGGWGSFKESFRLAVFIPFLDDETYAVHPGLPEDRHECNYQSDRALLFQPLPYSFRIHFGIVRGAQSADGTYDIQIHPSR